MTGWQKVVWMAFDTETTGVDVERDRIVTACVGVGDPKLGTWHPKKWLINPGIEIPAEATAARSRPAMTGLPGLFVAGIPAHSRPGADTLAGVSRDAAVIARTIADRP